jgi:4-methyl-5(b-hydroxyethyl)-thiazole monophosphate biosynthesis
MKKVLLFLAQGFEELEAAAFIDVFGWTRVTPGVEAVELITAGLRSEVRAAHSLLVRPQHLLEELDLKEFDAFALPGGFHDRGFTEAYSQEVLEAMRTIYDNGGAIASVCVGAKPLAKAGLLKGREATTYPLDGGVHTRYLEEHGASVVGAALAVSGRIITSSGPATAIDVAFKLLEILSGREDVERVREAMGFEAAKSV